MSLRSSRSATDTTLFVRFPSPLKVDGWEFRYANRMCREYMAEGLAQLGLNIVSVQDADELSDLPSGAMVLWWEDPLLMVAPETLRQLIDGIDKGYEAVAPKLSGTSFPNQQASPSFGIVNQATFEEYNSLSKRPRWQVVPALDPQFVLCRTQAFKTPPTDGRFRGKQAVLLDSLAFSFGTSTGHPRQDLLEMIPNEVSDALDIGCANGGLGRLWQERNSTKMDGLEPEPLQAAEARKWHRNVWEKPLETFEPDRTYDLIICGDVIEHLDDPWTQLARMARWIRPTGYMLLSVPNAGHWSLVADQANGKFPYLPWGLTCITHRRWFTESSIREALESTGFTPVRWEREQPLPSPKGETFIQTLQKAGLGNETSLRTHQIRVLAQKNS